MLLVLRKITIPPLWSNINPNPNPNPNPRYVRENLKTDRRGWFDQGFDDKGKDGHDSDIEKVMAKAGESIKTTGGGTIF